MMWSRKAFILIGSSFAAGVVFYLTDQAVFAGIEAISTAASLTAAFLIDMFISKK